MQWNPHERCFGNDLCKKNAEFYTDKMISDYKLDFITLLYFSDHNWKPSDSKYQLGGDSNYQAICSEDSVTTFYNSKKWKPLSAGQKGCMEKGPYQSYSS